MQKDRKVTDAGNVDSIIRDHIGWLVSGASATYFGPETALLAFGKPMLIVHDRPLHIPLGRKRECYANCVKAVLSCPLGQEELSYAEGFAAEKHGQYIPIQHAWLVDGQGRVIDPTWDKPDDHMYFGVVFKTTFVVDMLAVTNMEPGLLSAPMLMRRHFGSPTLFQAALNPLHHQVTSIQA